MDRIDVFPAPVGTQEAEAVAVLHAEGDVATGFYGRHLLGSGIHLPDVADGDGLVLQVLLHALHLLRHVAVLVLLLRHRDVHLRVLDPVMALHEDGEDEEDDELHREVNHALAAVLPAEGIEHEADHRGDGGALRDAVEGVEEGIAGDDVENSVDDLRVFVDGGPQIQYGGDDAAAEHQQHHDVGETGLGGAHLLEAELEDVAEGQRREDEEQHGDRHRSDGTTDLREARDDDEGEDGRQREHQVEDQVREPVEDVHDAHQTLLQTRLGDALARSGHSGVDGNEVEALRRVDAEEDDEEDRQDAGGRGIGGDHLVVRLETHGSPLLRAKERGVQERGHALDGCVVGGVVPDGQLGGGHVLGLDQSDVIAGRQEVRGNGLGCEGVVQAGGDIDDGESGYG